MVEDGSGHFVIEGVWTFCGREWSGHFVVESGLDILWSRVGLDISWLRGSGHVVVAGGSGYFVVEGGLDILWSRVGQDISWSKMGLDISWSRGSGHHSRGFLPPCGEGGEGEG